MIPGIIGWFRRGKGVCNVCYQIAQNRNHGMISSPSTTCSERGGLRKTRNENGKNVSGSAHSNAEGPKWEGGGAWYGVDLPGRSCRTGVGQMGRQSGENREGY